MIIEPFAKIPAVRRIALTAHSDERGYFARAFCEEEFAAAGLPSRYEQSSVSHNMRKGTLRGMHFQASPNAEAKVVRCIRGRIFDVAIDLRDGSPTRGEWVAETLSAENGLALFIPEGFAHGFQTLSDDTDVLYQITPAFKPGFGKGVRWNDPAFAIEWPLAEPLMSERDRSYADWKP